MPARRRPGPLAVEPGTVFAFRTSPLSRESPSETGRFGALMVLGHDDDIVVVGVLDGVWTQEPSLEEASACTLLRRVRFSFRNEVAVFGCGIDDDPELDGFAELGVVPLPDEMRERASKYFSGNLVGNSYTSADHAGRDVESEWRWAHDREALLREQTLAAEREEATRAEQRRRYETRLRHLTWEQLLAEDPFARWQPSPPFPPAAFRRAATERVHAACRELQNLGSRPRRPAVRSVLRELVVWFNEKDERAGGVIETEEREDIFRALEDLAHAARQPALLEEVAGWCTW